MWEIARSNKRKSVIFVFLMALLLVLMGGVFGEHFAQSAETGLLVAFVIWVILSIIAYFQGRNVFLAVSGAHKIRKEDHPRLFNIVEEMTIASLLPAIPEIYIIDDPAPNAFAVGRKPDSAAVAVTSGLLNTLNRDELQGVIAHEIGHIINRDTLFMSMLGVMLGSIVILSEIARRSLFFGGGRRRTRTSSSGGGQIQVILMIAGLVLMLLAPILARLIYLAASRKREYLADASAAIFTRLPEGLASALEKISVSPIRLRKINQVTAPMYTINPLQNMKLAEDSLFSTHPSTLNRVRILRSMAGGSGYDAYDAAFRAVTGQTRAIIPPSALKTAHATVPSRSRRSDPKSDPGTDQTKQAPSAMGMAGAVLTAAVLMDAAAEPVTPAAKVRETTDAIWKSRGYRFIPCPCGAALKVPPDYRRTDIVCLRCGRKHPAASAS
ncbi:M48 family metallopeptidase [bacterium]|nr:M48 family metallopeptidase [candidate division CSSED10-310 bacterium]